MRLAALYDIHGNLPALEAVLDDVRRERVDAIVVGGDVVPGPMPSECLHLLLSLDVPVHCIMGNGDREVLATRAGGGAANIPARFRETIEWSASQLSDDDARVMSAWPATVTLDVDGLGRVLFCHATPQSDTAIFTRTTTESVLLPRFAEVDAGVVVCGHTHMQFDRMVGGTRVVNAGSVGMPFGDAGACWLRLGPGLDLRRSTYDLASAAERVRATADPMAEEFATHNVLRQPTEQDMLAVLSASEVT